MIPSPSRKQDPVCSGCRHASCDLSTGYIICRRQGNRPLMVANPWYACTGWEAKP